MENNKEVYTQYAETDNNDDMTASDEQLDTSPSHVDTGAYPQRSWTKNQKRAVWIIAVIVTVLFVGVTFLLKIYGIELPFLS